MKKNNKIRITICATALLVATSLAVFGGLSLKETSAANTETEYVLDVNDAPTETLRLADVICDGMLYQQNKPVGVWGFAPTGSLITITLSEQESGNQKEQKQTRANEEGYFEVYLEGIPASYTEYKIVVTDEHTTVTAEHILFGELYVSSGQSNMGVNVRYCSNADEILDNANNPYIRVYMSPEIPSASMMSYTPAAYWRPEGSEGGSWARGDRSETIEGASAVAYNFALDLFERLNKNAEIPVGFLNVSKGSTSIEAWIARSAIDEQGGIVYDYLDKRKRLLSEDEYNQKGSQNFNQVSAMFNSKIAQVTNLYVQGILWYQGENNVGSEVAGTYYAQALQLLHSDWSRWFNEGKEEITLIFTQVGPMNYGYEGEALAYMWEGMSEAYNAQPEYISMATIYDVPLDWYNEDFPYRSPGHTLVKKPVGLRMSTFAYNRFYGGTGAVSSPVLKSAEFDDGKALISFKNVQTLKTTNGLDPIGFTLCGENRIFYPADAVLNADGTVTLSSRWVKEPVAAAYAFSEMIMSANVCSDEGFPVAPFRTDKVASIYYHPKDWQLCDATQYFVSYGSGKNPDQAMFRDGYTTSGNVTLSVCEEGDYGNALQLNYTLRGREEFWISPVLGQDQTDGRFEQFASYDTLSFKVRNTHGRDVAVSVTVSLADGRSWTAENLGGNTKVLANTQDYATYYFSLNPTFAESDATSSELSALRAGITDIRIVFRDYAYGSIELDSFDYGNISDLNLKYDSEYPDTPKFPDTSGENPSDEPNSGTEEQSGCGGCNGSASLGIVSLAPAACVLACLKGRRKNDEEK